jgi:hypothetical protein
VLIVVGANTLVWLGVRLLVRPSKSGAKYCEEAATLNVPTASQFCKIMRDHCNHTAILNVENSGRNGSMT